MFWNRSQSLSRQINHRVLLLSLIALVGLGGTLVESLQHRLNRVHHDLVQINREAAATFDLFILDLESSLLNVGATLHVQRDATVSLRYLLSRHPSILVLCYLDANGKVITQHQTFGQTSNANCALLNGWTETLVEGEVQISNLQYAGAKPYLEMVVPVVDDVGLANGSLIARLDLTGLWDTTLDVEVGRTGYAYLTTQNGRLITYRNLKTWKGQPNLDHLVGQSPQSIEQSKLPIYRGLGRQWVLASARPLRDVPWYAVVEQPLQEALQPLLLPAIALMAGL